MIASLRGLTWGEIALVLFVIAPLYTLGYLAGMVVNMTLFIAATIVAGYKASRNG